MILIVLPVYNEENTIKDSVRKIVGFLDNRYDFEILIVDNGSTDKTLEKAKKLCEDYSGIKCIHIDKKGRGRALRKAWSESNADIFSYMDIDLSTDLSAFPRLIEEINNGYDIAIGSRHIKGAKVYRSFRREILSRGYNILLKLFFGVNFSDAQCGFKAVNKRIVEEVIPDVKDQEWFFDTEMLVIAEKKGFRIKEVPVYWEENRESKVKVFKTIFDYMTSIFRLRLSLP